MGRVTEATEPPEQDRGVQLMLALQQGREEAFAELVEEYQSAAFSMLRRVLGPHQPIEDLAQEAFLRVWRSRESYQPRGRFTTFLYRITYNLALNQLRGNKRKPLSSMPQTADGAVLEPEDLHGAAPEAGADGRDWAGIIEGALGQLPENQRAALVFQHYDGLSLAEVAQVLGTSEKAVKSLLHRARTRLRELLQPYHEAEND